MRKIISLLILILFACTACIRPDAEPEETVPIDEVLKIRTWLLDEDLEGKGRWGYISDEERTYPYKADGGGYWIPDDGVTQVENEDVFVLEELEIGVPRTMAPMTMSMAREGRESINYYNLLLYIDFEGIVEVVKVEPNDSSIRLVYSLNSPIIEGETAKRNGPCTINVCPVGKVVVSESTKNLVARNTLVDKEYILQIRCCAWDGTPVVTADVKITSIPDPEYSWEKDFKEGRYGELYQVGEERTRFCKIELLSYEYNEMHLLKEAASMYD
ncbi:MAG: hypothetical protein J6D10_12560 [Clostridia bacterium]|nr:hypothetical protein [Clostridia bacterium]